MLTKYEDAENGYDMPAPMFPDIKTAKVQKEKNAKYPDRLACQCLHQHDYCCAQTAGLETIGHPCYPVSRSAHHDRLRAVCTSGPRSQTSVIALAMLCAAASDLLIFSYPSPGPGDNPGLIDYVEPFKRLWLSCFAAESVTRFTSDTLLVMTTTAAGSHRQLTPGTDDAIRRQGPLCFPQELARKSTIPDFRCRSRKAWVERLSVQVRILMSSELFVTRRYLDVNCVKGVIAVSNKALWNALRLAHTPLLAGMWDDMSANKTLITYMPLVAAQTLLVTGHHNFDTFSFQNIIDGMYATLPTLISFGMKCHLHLEPPDFGTVRLWNRSACGQDGTSSERGPGDCSLQSEHETLTVGRWQAFMNVLFYAFNYWVCIYLIGAFDGTGGAVTTHVFGAFFGAACAAVATPEGAESDPDSQGRYQSEILSLFGSLMMWAYYPSYNSFYAPSTTQQTVAVNTYLALLGSSIAGLSASAIFNGNLKLTVFDAQRSCIAGGVAMGSVANLLATPWQVPEDFQTHEEHVAEVQFDEDEDGEEAFL
eukprot:753000-Hanusia_phi.AAC.8